jgi:cystathionine beta-synthase
VAVAPEDPASYYSTAERLVAEIPGAYRPNQYANPHNPRAHYETTGPEIWEQTEGRVTHVVAGVGTGGTITGIGRYLKERDPAIQIIGADPEGSVFSGGSGRPYLVEGVGEDFWPDNVDTSVIDRVEAVSDSDSFLMARATARQEGLLIGGSCGTALAAALRVGEELGPEHLVVVLLPDSGRGYLSRVFDDEWMANRGFITECDRCVGAVLAARGGGPGLLYVNPEHTAREAIALMRANGVSQLPVCKNTPPFALAEVSGAVDELALMDQAFGNPLTMDRPVLEVMGPKLPTIGIGQPVERAVEMLDHAPALLVLSGGRPLAVLTRTDVLSYLTDSIAVHDG